MKYIVLVTKICLALLLFTSCDKEREDIFNSSAYNLKDNVKCIKDSAFNVKIKAGKVTRSKQTGTSYIAFNEEKKITTVEESNYSIVYLYDSKNRIQNIISENIESYTPVYDKDNYLSRQIIRYKEDNQLFETNYKYDEFGNIISIAWSVDGTEYNIKQAKYNTDRILTEMLEIRNNKDKIVYTSDSLGNTIVEEHYDINTEKPKTTYTYAYTYDEHGNWLTRIKYSNNKAIALNERTIEYFEAKDNVAAYTPQKANFSSVFGYFENVKYRLFDEFRIGETPSMILMIVLMSVSLAVFITTVYKKRELVFSNFGGTYRSNGMKRMWMYNKEPYLKVATFLLIAVITFIASLVAIFLVGGTVWGLFWLIKILLNIIIWIGVVATIIGGLILFFAKDPWGLVLLIPGGLIWANDDSIERAGNNLVEAGFNFMQELNMLQWGINLFSSYWDIMLLVFILPLILFIGIALVIIVLNSLLVGIEFIITKIYNVNRPCSACGSTIEPLYLVNDREHPVALRPGMYGVLSQTSPTTKEKLPTLLVNGRWKLNRKCSACGTRLDSKMSDNSKKVGFGTDIHIGIVGHRSSGKSYLLYSGLHLLMDNHPQKFTQIEANNETRIEDKYRRIAQREGIQTNDSNQYKAIQLIYKDKLRPIPYHLYFYDVAGEKFNSSSRSHQTAMDFYRNVQSIIFVIDPKMVDYTGIPTSEELKNWLTSGNTSSYDEKYNVGSTFTMLKEILNKANRKSKKIDFSFVCVKKDLKYFEASGYKSDTITPSEIERYICNDMGLNNVVYSAKAEFKSVGFYSVSTFSNDKGSLKYLFTEILKQQGVKI